MVSINPVTIMDELWRVTIYELLERFINRLQLLKNLFLNYNTVMSYGRLWLNFL